MKITVKENATNFVEAVFNAKDSDHGFRARWRRAMSPSQAQNVWGDLTRFIDVRNAEKRLIYTLIGSAIAWEDGSVDGSQKFGKVLRECYGDRLAESVDSSSPAVMRLRRLVASRTSIEAAEVLQPILALIRSKRPGKLHYARLMVQLSIFDLDPNQVKAEWVHDFYIPEEKKE